MADKADRAGRLAVWMADQIDACGGPRRAAHPTRLAKTDLLTNMVVEFTELQGVMGGHYLRLEGAPEELWTTVATTILPQGFDGEVRRPRRASGGRRRSTGHPGRAVGGRGESFGIAGSARPAASGPGSGQDRRRGRLEPRPGPGDRPRDGVGVRPVDGDIEEISGALSDFVADRVRRYLMDVVGCPSTPRMRSWPRAGPVCPSWWPVRGPGAAR